MLGRFRSLELAMSSVNNCVKWLFCKSKYKYLSNEEKTRTEYLIELIVSYIFA